MRICVIIARTAAVGAVLLCTGCSSKKEEVLQIAVAQPPSAAPERRSFEEKRHRVEESKIKLALPDGETAGKIGYAYHATIWKHPIAKPRVSVIDALDAWLVVIHEVPPGAVGGDAYILLSKQSGAVLGAIHEQ